ncbi:MAG: BTAD domain-containing putative transcriptional regulator [Anaerolineae bacterium]
MHLSAGGRADAQPGSSPTVTLRFHLLGELAVAREGTPLPLPPYGARGLLAALLIRPRIERRERLAGLLSPDVPEAHGRRRLSHQLWQLRRWLPELPVESDAEVVRLSRESLWIDVDAFQEASARGTLDGWLAALSLYRGDLLEGLYDDWLLEEREALYLQFVQLSHRVSEHLLRERRFAALLPVVDRLVQREPYDERALRQLMRAYRGVGRRGAALAAYDRLAMTIADEWDAEPEAATQALAEAIRLSAPESSAAVSSLPVDGSAEGLLRYGREALGRMDRPAVEGALQRLRVHPEAPEGDVRLLEIDLALCFEAFEQAEELLSESGSRPASIWLREAQLAVARYRIAAGHELASQALLMARAASDTASELEALLVLACTQQELGQGVHAVRSAERALARSDGAPRSLAQSLLARGHIQTQQGRYVQALASLAEAHSVALEHGLRRELGLALRGLRLAQTHTNALGAALATAQQELSMWRDLGLPRQEATALEGLALVENHLGCSADSLRTMQRALEISRGLGEPVRIGISLYHLAASQIYHDDGLAGEAIAHGREALDLFRAHAQPHWEAASQTILGYASWVDGRHGSALDYLRQAYAARERLGELGYLPELLAYQALALLGLGQEDQALRLAQQAMFYLAQGEVSDEVVCDIVYAHAAALAANGRAAEAASVFEQAYALLLDRAAAFEEEAARQAFFHRNPTMRRLMHELGRRGIAPSGGAGVQRVQLRAARGEGSLRVAWTVDAGPADVALKRAEGAIALRRTRLARLLAEARAQGGKPTVEDLARALAVSPRTIQRDLAALRDRVGGHV